MFSRFFGKRDKPEQAPGKPAAASPGKAPQAAVPAAPAVRREVPQFPPRGSAAGAARPPQPGFVRPAHIPREAPKAQPEREVDFVLPTAPMELQQRSLEERKEESLGVLAQHHARIANTLRTLWGYKECSVYINRLIMAGGDGMGHARIGFTQEVVDTLLALSDIHDAQFGPPDTLSGALSLSL